MIEKVRKVNGSIEDFDREKIIRSVMSAGGTRALGERVAYNVERSLGNQKEVRTTQIRRIVVYELGRVDRAVKDAFLFYDRLNKGRITFEAGKFFIVNDGDLYLGRGRRQIRPVGFRRIDDIRGLLDEFDEDMRLGILGRDVADRRIGILLDAIRNSNMPDEDKERALELVADFRLRWIGK